MAFVAPGGDLCLASLAAPGAVEGNGASIEIVDEGGGDIIGLAWSPDGATLGCVRIRDDETRVVRLYRVEGGKTDAGEALDLPADQPLCDLSWSPDGKYLAVDVGTGGGGRTLLILDAQTRRGLSVVGYAWGWCWAPATGAPRLAIGVPQEVEPPLPFEDGRSCSVVVVDVATWATGVLYPGTAQSLAFPRAWLADGRLLFMVLSADPAPALWEVRPDEDASAARPAGDVPVQNDDRALRALLPLELREGFTGRSSWAPGGDLVAIAVKTGAGTHVYVVDTASGQSRDIGPGTMPAWRPATQ